MSEQFVKRRPVFLDYRFLGTTLLGTVSVTIVSMFGSLESEVAILGTWLSILAGLLLAQMKSAENSSVAFTKTLSAAGLVPNLTYCPDIIENYFKITQALSALSTQNDPVLHEFAIRKLDSIADQIYAVANGEIVFASTESWRVSYEQILRGGTIGRYRSVAWFKSHDYWQDEPGKKSLNLNLELQNKGLEIQRIVIVRDELWADGENLPVALVVDWIDLQHRHGIKVSLIKESQLAKEPELCRDFGIYDNRALGVQELDDRCRTVTFTIYFDKELIDRALSHWEGLMLFARPYEAFVSC